MQEGGAQAEEAAPRGQQLCPPPLSCHVPCQRPLGCHCQNVQGGDPEAPHGHGRAHFQVGGGVGMRMRVADVLLFEAIEIVWRKSEVGEEVWMDIFHDGFD